MPRVSIIIRSRNEERWIGHNLDMIHRQVLKDFEIILVDNDSEDATVAVARRKGIDRLLRLECYLPGLSLNTGIRASNGEFLVFISAHCVPTNQHWLENLVAGLDNPEIVGVYGRQIPLSFSTDVDKRDLLTTFGLDRRIQERDYFFHNANSAIRRETWERHPFDETVTNIEDRLWAKEVTESGMKLLYEPEAVVYHHHGIHQNMNLQRARGTVSILEKMDGAIQGLPECMLPQNVPVAAILPVLSHLNPASMDNLIEDLGACGFVDFIALISELDEVEAFCRDKNLHFIRRPSNLMPEFATIEEVIHFGFLEVEKKGFFPELVVYADHKYPRRPNNLFHGLIRDIQLDGMDAVCPAFEVFNNYWVRNGEGQFQRVGTWLPHQRREPLYWDVNALGMVVRSTTLRQGHLIGERTGLYLLDQEFQDVFVRPPLKEER
ncbi:MAG: glycosyltransferase family 2 protein [Magnetococcales bacterium]|nr:glycosyltransferase family 2 protein [Magnetococcales bacterium]